MCSSVGGSTLVLKDVTEWNMMFGTKVLFRHIVESKSEAAVMEFVEELRPFLNAGPLNVTYAVPQGVPDKNQLRYMQIWWRSCMEEGCVVK